MGIKEFIRAQIDGSSPYKDIESYLDHFLPDLLQKHSTLQQAFGVEEHEMQELYKLAYEAYSQDLLEQAKDYFQWLTILNPYAFKHWMGFAASQHLLNNFQGALKSYAVATLLETDNPLPHFHAAECYLALNTPDEAAIALEQALKRTYNKPYFASLAKEIQLTQTELKNAHCCL